MSEIRSQATPATVVVRVQMADDVQTALGYSHIFIEDADSLDVADRLRGAGWSKPRTVNSVTELHALPVESVVRNRDGWIGEISIVSGKPVIFWIGNECEDELKDIALPATVLFTPGDAG